MDRTKGLIIIVFAVFLFFMFYFVDRAYSKGYSQGFNDSLERSIRCVELIKIEKNKITRREWNDKENRNTHNTYRVLLF